MSVGEAQKPEEWPVWAPCDSQRSVPEPVGPEPRGANVATDVHVLHSDTATGHSAAGAMALVRMGNRTHVEMSCQCPLHQAVTHGGTGTRTWGEGGSGEAHRFSGRSSIRWGGNAESRCLLLGPPSPGHLDACPWSSGPFKSLLDLPTAAALGTFIELSGPSTCTQVLCEVCQPMISQGEETLRPPQQGRPNHSTINPALTP